MEVMLTVSFAAVATFALVLLVSYRHLPLRELRRRAREDDQTSQAVFRAAVYSSSLGTVLWLLIGIFGSLFFWSLAKLASDWLTVAIGMAFIWAVMVWLPARWPARFSLKAAAFTAPVLARLSAYLFTITNPVTRVINKYWPAPAHTNLYEADDILDLLEDQTTQDDNRIHGHDLSMAMQALSIGHRQVREVMRPISSSRVVSVDDHLGPVLMNELHTSDQTYFPVYKGKKDNIVGALSQEDLSAEKGGRVKDLMRSATNPIHEQDTLRQVLLDMVESSNQFFLVIDNFDECVGIVTVKDMLKQIVGSSVHDEPETEEKTSAETDENLEETPEEPGAPAQEVPEVVE